MKSTIISTVTLLLSSTLIEARPTSSNSATQHSVVKRDPNANSVIEVPLQRRANVDRSPEAFLAKANHLRNKYGFDVEQSTTSTGRQRRAGSVAMSAYQDSEYVGTITIGTPATAYSVILDTGSADLIMAQEGCSGCVSTTNGYSPSASTTSASSSTNFQIQYGSGSASGVLVSDNVTIAGYTINSQGFASCDVMNNIVAANISGLLGLGWQNLATSGKVPLLQALAQNNELPAQVFAFNFKSYAYDQLTSDFMSGGKMVIGGTDTSAYTGDINWISIDSSKTYWSIPLQGISVGGNDLGISANTVVIDSGTTLIGAPQSAVEAIYAQVPNSQAVSLSGQSGYYAIPCSSSVNVAFTFGGVSYSIPSSSFNAGAFDSRGTYCLGAIFTLTTTSTSSTTTSRELSWIIGDAFLTGVYSAFRFSSPAAVGFAKLGSGGTAVASSNGTSSSSGSTDSVTVSAATITSTRSSLAFILGGLLLALFV